MKIKIENIESLIEKSKVISFDIFDTLICRNVLNPKDIFELVQRKYVQLYGYEKYLTEFKEHRIQAERNARSLLKREILLDEIYEQMIDEYPENIVKTLKNLEIEVELDFCQANKDIFSIYKKCINLNKKVIIISDMYLPQSVIQEILKKCGIEQYDCLYISCVYGKTKATGELYDLVLKNEAISAKDMLHIGDNKKSDIIQARKKQIKTFWINNNNRNKNTITDLDENILHTFLTNNKKTEKNIFSNVGYNCFGPFLYGYIKWIHEQIIKQQCSSILFLSRDGYIMKKVYDILYPKSSAKSYYFYASRRALQVAAICYHPDYESVISTMFVPRLTSVSWLLNRWGLESSNYKQIVNELNLSMDKEISGKDLLYNKEIKSLYNTVKKDIISNSRNENIAMLQYIRTFNLKGNIAFVDIGWNGNMQNAFETSIIHHNMDLDTYGMYVGINSSSIYQNYYQMSGYLYQKGKNEDLYFKTKYICSLMELFFMAPHGSMVKYEKDDNKIFIRLEQFEYEGTDTAKYIFTLQKAAFEFINDFKYFLEYTKNDSNVYFKNIFKRFTQPDLSTAISFGKLEMWDDKWIKIADGEHLFNLLIHPCLVKKNFINSSWKIGYLKRMFKVPFGYNKVVWYLRKFYKK